MPNTLRRICSLARLTYSIGLRDRIFVSLVLLGVALLGVSLLLGLLGVGESTAVLRNAGLAGVELTGVLLVIFTVVFNWYRERESRMRDIYLTVVSREGYLAGKALGYLALLALYCALAAAGLCLLWFPNGALSARALAALYPMFLKLALVMGCTLVACVVFRSSFVALCTGVFVYVNSELIGSALTLVSRKGSHGQTLLLQGLYHLLPHVDLLDAKTQAAYAEALPAGFFVRGTLYSLAYGLCLYLIACCIFRTRHGEWS